MPNNIRFYLDENVHRDIAEGLRHRSVDVVTTPEAGNMGLGDFDQLAFATAEGRVFVTQDSDFLVLHSEGVHHAGIVYYKDQTRTVKQILRGLLALYETTDSDEMLTNVKFL